MSYIGTRRIALIAMWFGAVVLVPAFAAGEAGSAALIAQYKRWVEAIAEQVLEVKGFAPGEVKVVVETVDDIAKRLKIAPGVFDVAFFIEGRYHEVEKAVHLNMDLMLYGNVSVGKRFFPPDIVDEVLSKQPEFIREPAKRVDIVLTAAHEVRHAEQDKLKLLLTRDEEKLLNELRDLNDLHVDMAMPYSRQKELAKGLLLNAIQAEADADDDSVKTAKALGYDPETILESIRRKFPGIEKVSSDGIHPANPIRRGNLEPGLEASKAEFAQKTDLDALEDLYLARKASEVRFYSRLLPGKLDVALMAILTPSLFYLDGGSEAIKRRLAYMAVENLVLEPAILKGSQQLLAKAAVKAATRAAVRAGTRAATTGLKATMASTLILIPVAVAESIGEDAIEEHIRTSNLRSMGITDISGEPFHVFARVGEGYSEFFWNSSEERAIKTSAAYERILNSFFQELTDVALSNSQELSDGQKENIYGEATKRANRLLPVPIDRDIRVLRDLREVSKIKSVARALASRLGADPEFANRNGGPMLASELVLIALNALGEDEDYAKSPMGFFLKPYGDLVYDSIRGEAVRNLSNAVENALNFWAGKAPPGRAIQERREAMITALQELLSEEAELGE